MGSKVDSSGCSSFVVENDGKRVDISDVNNFSSNRLDPSWSSPEWRQLHAEETHDCPTPSVKSSSSSPPAPSQSHVEETKDSESETLADVFVLVCVFVGNLLYGIDYSGIGIFYKHLIAHFDTSAAAVGWCSSINGCFQCVIGLFASHPIKVYGCRLPGCFGSLLAAVGYCLCTLAPNLATIYFFYGTVTGIGSGLYNLSSSVIVLQRFKRNKILANGTAWLGTSVGLALGSIVVSSVVDWYGWRSAFLILGAVQANRIWICLFYRSPKQFVKGHRHHDDVVNGNTCGAIIGYLRGSFDFRLLRQPSFFMFTVANSLQLAGVTGYVPHSFNRALRVGLSHPEAILAASLSSATTVVARTAVSLVANRAKIKTTIWFAFGMFLSALSVAFLFIFPEPYATMSSTVMFGFHLACTTTFSSVAAVEIMGIDVLPRCLAILMFFASVSKLGAAPAVGWVYDVTGNYNYAYLLIGCWGLIGGIIMVTEVILDRLKRRFDSESRE